LLYGPRRFWRAEFLPRLLDRTWRRLEGPWLFLEIPRLFNGSRLWQRPCLYPWLLHRSRLLNTRLLDRS
jgi:hypothetical protein